MVNMLLDEKIRNQRKTGYVLACEIGRDPATISRVINGHVRPTRRTVLRLCQALKCNPAEIGFPEVSR